MTRYVLQNRETGHVEPTQPKDGFASYTEAVIYAADHQIPVTYFPMPVAEEKP